MSTMKILGKEIHYSEDYKEIDALKFFIDNPRVYSVVREIPGFDSLTEEEKQEKIFEKLLKEPSVKNLKDEVKRHGGLLEPIVVSMNTWEVVEGNSRLAVYKELHDSQADGDWGLIPCRLISKIEDDQLAAYLSQIHIKGKTKWPAFEKYNFAYVRFIKSTTNGNPKKEAYSQIANLFGESEATIRHRVKVIKLMEDRQDNVRGNLSYYDVLVRNADSLKLIESGGLNTLLGEIKRSGEAHIDGDEEDEDKKEFTAQEMRRALPNLIQKPKLLNQYENGKITFKEAASRAEVSECKQNVVRATSFLGDISKRDIGRLSVNDFNAFAQSFKRLKKELERVEGIIQLQKKI